MQLRRSSIIRGFLLVAAMSVVTAACGGGGRTTEQGASQAPATTQAATNPPATTSADPLQGEWRTEYTCQQSVRAIRARLSEKKILKQIGSWESYLEEFGGKPSEDDPCHGATGTDARLARFADGNLALCDAKTGGCEVHATYQVNGDHLTVDDPEGNLCPCPGTWDFEIAGDQLTFHTDADSYVIGTWEAAPWTRES